MNDSLRRYLRMGLLLVPAVAVACAAPARRAPEPAPAAAAPAAAPTAAAAATGTATAPGPTTAASLPASGPDHEKAQNECINRALVASEKKRNQGVASQAALGDYVKCMEEKGYRATP